MYEIESDPGMQHAHDPPLLRDQYFRVRFPFDPRRDVVWREVCHYLQARYLAPNLRILDIGAAYCNFINNIQGRERHALDISPIIEEYAAPGVATHVRPCTDLRCFEEESLDVVFVSNLFEHLTRADLCTSLAEIHRVLASGGRLIVLQPNFRYCFRSYFDDYTHTYIYTDRSLCDIFEACGFQIADVRPRFLPVNMKSTLRLSLPRLDWIVWLYLRLPLKPLAGQMLIVARKPS
jgi:predicted SAM-dependent methyltransferase